MTPKEPYTSVDWVRLLFILPAIVFFNFCFVVYLGAGMGSAPGQDPFQLLVFLLPIPLCIVFIGVLCESRLELWIASLLAVLLWLLFLFFGLLSSTAAYPRGESRDGFFSGVHFLLIGLCALCALLGQRIRRFLLARNSNYKSLSILPSNDS